MLPGYPKLIEDVWGIQGPVDAAFTRINCQGKTYIFKVPLSISEELSRAADLLLNVLAIMSALCSG